MTSFGYQQSGEKGVASWQNLQERWIGFGRQELKRTRNSYQPLPDPPLIITEVSPAW